LSLNETYAQPDVNLSFCWIGDMLPAYRDEWRAQYPNSREPIAKHLVAMGGPDPFNPMVLNSWRAKQIDCQYRVNNQG
jgi:hypothetical protein